ISTGNLVYNPAGSFLATTTDDNHALVVDAKTLKVVRRLAADPNGVAWAAWSPDGRYLATGGSDGLVQLWDASTWRRVRETSVISGSVHSLEFDRTGNELLVTGTGGRTSLWTVPGLQQIGGDLTAPVNQWTTSRFTGDGSRVVLVVADGNVFVWPSTV